MTGGLLYYLLRTTFAKHLSVFILDIARRFLQVAIVSFNIINMSAPTGTMKAVVFHGPGKVTVEDRPIPQCKLLTTTKSRELDSVWRR